MSLSHALGFVPVRVVGDHRRFLENAKIVKVCNPMSSNQDRRTPVLVKQNLATQLREEILAGKISAGAKIVEGTWARHFGVAQSSVREALNILIAEGFVTKGTGEVPAS